MYAIQIEDGAVLWKEVEMPEVGLGEVLIKVHASAINRADLLQRKGRYPPPPGASDILGLECSGVVVDTGEGVTSYQEGDEVCALMSGGGHAQYVVAPAGQVLPIPKGWSFNEAASIPEVYATAYLNIYMEANTRPGDQILLHAGASGVGTAAIQIGKVLGNETFVTVGSEDKIQECVELGASAGFNRHEGDFADAVLSWTSGRGVATILDPVGAAYLTSNLKCLAMDGALVIIGLMGGAEATVPFAPMMASRQRIICSTLRARSVAAKSQVMANLKSKIWPHFESGEIKPVIDSVFPIQDLEGAHNRIESNESVGKVILEVNQEEH